MDLDTLVAIIISVIIGMLSDELKHWKGVIFTRGGSIKKRFVSHREELINKYKDCPIYRSHSNVVAIKSMLFFVFYVLFLFAFMIFDMALTIFEGQMVTEGLSFTSFQYNAITIFLAFVAIYYLFSASFRIRCHNKACL